MELEHSIYGSLSGLHPIIPFIFSMFILFTTIIVSLLIFILKKKYFQCKCEICHSYVTSNWKQNFVNLCDWYTHLLQTSPTKTIHVHVLGNIITANPENVEYMLKTNFDNYPKGKPFSSILGDLLGDGIFNVDGDAWRFQRKMASLELDRQSIKSFSFHVVEDEVARHLIPSLMEDGSFVDLQEIFRAFSFSTMCRFSFGVEMKELEAIASLEGFSPSFDIASNLSAQRALEVCSVAWRVKRLLGVGKERQLRDAIKKIDALAMAVIRLRRRKMGSIEFNSSHKEDLLSRFMGAVGSNRDKFLRDIIVSFLLAGRDTMASALTSFFWLVARHPLVASSILSEADKVLGRDQGLSNYEQVKNLKYLQAALYESMRLYPPVQFDSKFSLRDDVMPDGTRVRKGDRVTYHPYAMGRMVDVWGKDCLEFRPERWLDESGAFCQKCPYKYPVFQAGVRDCLGKEMALVEMKCVILSILREFHVELASFHVACDKVPRFSPGLTATLKGGLPVTLHRRISRKIVLR